MAQPADIFQTYTNATNIREDLQDFISNISPIDCPIQASIGKTKSKSTKHEWLTDELAASVDDNAQVEGDTITTGASTPATRNFNYTQIFAKTAAVSGTAEAVDAAGRKSEMARILANRGAELKRDVEKSLGANKLRNAGTVSTTARLVGGIPSWLTNADIADDATGAAGDGSDIHTDGTARPFTETQVKNVMQQCYTNGGRPTKVFVPPNLRADFSDFSGGSTSTQDAASQKVTATVGVYVSDFGVLSVETDLHMPIDMVFIIDPALMKIAMLRDTKVKQLADISDGIQMYMNQECTLQMTNPLGHGIVTDLV